MLQAHRCVAVVVVQRVPCKVHINRLVPAMPCHAALMFKGIQQGPPIRKAASCLMLKLQLLASSAVWMGAWSTFQHVAASAITSATMHATSLAWMVGCQGLQGTA
jgi:hypothetical protein